MKTFMSNPKGAPSHLQDMKIHADSNPEGAGAVRRRP